MTEDSSRWNERRGSASPVFFGGEHRTSPALAEVACVAALSGIAWPKDVDVFDPTLGHGVMLTTITRALQTLSLKVNATGVDINSGVVDEAKRIAEARGVTLNLRVGNVLLDDLVPRASADIVVSEPPMVVDWQAWTEPVQQRSNQGWYPRGLGRARDAGWLFLQRGIAGMKSAEQGGSRFVTFMNPGMLKDSAGGACRSSLLDEDLLEAIVRLPTGVAAHTSIQMVALVLRTGKPTKLRGHAHVVDLRSFMTTRNRGAQRHISPDGLRLLWSALAPIPFS